MKEYEIQKNLIDKSKEEIKRKQLEAQNNAASISAFLVNNFDALNKDPKEKEKQVLDYLFNEFVANSDKQSKVFEEKEIQNIKKKRLEKFGLDDLSDNLITEPLSDIRKVRSMYRLNNLDGVLADTNGAETLKSLIISNIKNSDEYKALMAAKNKNEMGTAVNNAKSSLLSKMENGEMAFSGINIPDSAVNIYKAMMSEYDGSMDQCHRSLDAAINKCLGEMPQYRKYNLESLSPESLKKNAENMHDLNKFFDAYDSFSWFSSGDTKFSDLKDSVNEISKMAKALGNPANPISSKTFTKYVKTVKEVIKKANEYNSDKKNTDTEKKYAVSELIKALSVSISNSKKLNNDQMLKDAEALGVRDMIEIDDSLVSYNAELREKSVFRGEKYRNVTIHKGNGSYTISRWGAYSISVMALAATGKYTFDEIADNDKLLKEKEEIFDEVVNRASNKTPENQKWIAEKIYKGQKVIRDLIDEADKGVDYNDPHFEKTDLYRKLSFIRFMYFDSWQEMKNCANEITELAKEENPAFADYVTFKEYLSTTQGLAAIFRQSSIDYVSILRDYIDGTQPDIVNTLILRAANCYLGKKLVLNYYKEHPDVKYSERGDESVSSACLSIATVITEKDAGPKQITRAISQDPEILKAFLTPLLNGTIYNDINVSYDKETSMPIFDGLKELGDLFDTRNVEYIKEKLADKSYLKRNSIENRMSATRKARTDLLIDKKTGKIRSVLELDAKETKEAAKLFDDIFGPFLNKKGVSDYLYGKSGRSIADLFYVGNMTLRQAVGPMAEEMFINRGDDNSVKAIIVALATNPALELKVKDFERNLQTGKYDSEIKGIIDIEDMDRIKQQVPYLTSIESFKGVFNKLYKSIDTKAFTESQWTEFYKHEFHKIAEEGLIPEDRVISAESIKAKVNPVHPYEEVFEDLKTLYGPKQKFIKEWAGKQNGTEAVYHKQNFLSNMKDVNPGSFDDDSFTALAYFCAFDPDYIEVPKTPEIDDSIMSHDIEVEISAHKWTTDIHAMGNGKPRISMYNNQAAPINAARRATANMISKLDNGEAKPLADSVVKGIRSTLGRLKLLSDFRKDYYDVYHHIYMLNQVKQAIDTNAELSNAVNSILTPEEIKELKAVISFQNVIDKRNIAIDKLNKADKGEIELSTEEREEFIKDISKFEHLSKRWVDNYNDFISSDEYAREAEKVMNIKKLDKSIAWQTLAETTFTENQKAMITFSDEFIEDVMNDDLQDELSNDITNKIKIVKEDFKDVNEEYQNAIKNFNELNVKDLQGNQLEDLYMAERLRCNLEYQMLQYAGIVAGKVSSVQLANIISGYNEIAKEKGWSQLNSNETNAKNVFDSMSSPKNAGEKLDAFYNIVFGELERTPSVFDDILDETQHIRGIDNLKSDKSLDYPAEKKIAKLKAKNISRATKDMLDNVNANLAEKADNVIPFIQRYESVDSVIDNITRQAKAKEVDPRDRKIDFSDDVKDFAVKAINKMKEYGLITGNTKAEQGAKVYAHHKILDAKENLKKAVASGNIEKIDEANELYEAELEKMRDIFAIVKKGIKGKEIVAGNLDTIRTKDVPAEFSYDYQVDSVVNGLYVIAETCARMNVSVEDYLNNPVIVVEKHIQTQLAKNRFESKIASSKTFAESFNALYKAGEDEIMNPSFMKNITGGSIGTTIGRPLDVICFLEDDPEKLIDLESKKFALTERVANHLDNEQNYLESVYRLSNLSDGFMLTKEYQTFINGLKDGYLSEDMLDRRYVRVFYKNGKAEALNEDDYYSSSLKTENLYEDITKKYNDNKEFAKKGPNIVKRVMVETMYDYLMEHPEDSEKPEYKALLELAGKASKELGVKYPNSADERLMTPEIKFKKWQNRINNEINKLSDDLENEEKEFDRQYQELVKSGADKEAIKDLLAIRLSELIEGYNHYRVTESYLRLRAEQLVDLRDNPGKALPEHPKFVDYNYDDAKYDYEMIKDRVRGEIFPEHLSSVEAYKEWRLKHDVVIGEDGSEKVVESDSFGLSENDLSPEEWRMSWENAIRDGAYVRSTPVDIIDVDEFLENNVSGAELNSENKPEIKTENKPEDNIINNIDNVDISININNENAKDLEIPEIVIGEDIQKVIDSYEKEKNEQLQSAEYANYDNEEKMLVNAKAVSNVVLEMINSTMECQRQLEGMDNPKDYASVLNAMKSVLDTMVGTNNSKNTLGDFARKYRKLMSQVNKYLKDNKASLKDDATVDAAKSYELLSQFRDNGNLLIETFNSFSGILVGNIKNSKIINKNLENFTMAEALDNYMGSKELKKFFEEKAGEDYVSDLLDNTKNHVDNQKMDVMEQHFYDNLIKCTKDNPEMDMMRYVVSDDYAHYIKPSLVDKAVSLRTAAQVYVISKYIDKFIRADTVEEKREIASKITPENFNKEVKELENNVAFKAAHQCDPAHAEKHYDWISSKTEYSAEHMKDFVDGIRNGETNNLTKKFAFVDYMLMYNVAVTALYSNPKNRQYLDSLYIMGEFGCAGGAAQANKGIREDVIKYFNNNPDAKKLYGGSINNLDMMINFVSSEKVQKDIMKIVEKNISRALSAKIGKMKRYQEYRNKRAKVDRVKEEIRLKEEVRRNHKARIKHNKEFIKEADKEGHSYNKEGLEQQIRESEQIIKEVDKEILDIKREAKEKLEKMKEEEKQNEERYQQELKEVETEKELKRKVNSTKKKLQKAQDRVKELEELAEESKTSRPNMVEAYLADAREAGEDVQMYEEKLQKATEEYDKFLKQKKAKEEQKDKEEDQKELHSEDQKEGPKNEEPKKEEPKKGEPKKEVPKGGMKMS